MSKWLFTRKELRKTQRKAYQFWKKYAKTYNSDWAKGYADCAYDNLRDLINSKGTSRLEFVDDLNATLEIFNDADSWYAGYRCALRDLRDDMLKRKVRDV